MNVISKLPFLDAAKKYPNDRKALLDAFRVLRANNFNSPNELRAIFPSLDNFKYKKGWWVIDIGGNNLRVLSFIQYVNHRMYIKHIVDHKEYDKLADRYRSSKK